MNLNGTWKLYYFKGGERSVNTIDELKSADLTCINATVPGNVELDLSAAGILPSDLFKGMNITKAEKFETYEWWYETSFVPKEPKKGEKVILRFGAVDCFAAYFLNNEKIGSSDNMFMSQEFDVGNKLKFNQKNTLHVHIHSAIIEAAKYENEISTSLYNWGRPQVSAWVRKAPHSYGWDIMPRAVSAGIWRDVTLQYRPESDFKFLYFHLKSQNKNGGQIVLCYDSNVCADQIFNDWDITVSGKCGEHAFEKTCWAKGKAGVVSFFVEGLKLWWPKNYGEPNMYDITVTVHDKKTGKLLLTKSVRRGFRTLKLERTDTVCKGGRFEFIVNGVKVMAVGSNWVPMDAYHSRDKGRYARALEMANDLNCNILRCWGGNVYEDHEFFDYCDDHGIMVWQDFAMGCASYPQSPEFVSRLEKEAEWVVKELRDHCSLAIWSGDNENDEVLSTNGADPNSNILTRKILPEIVRRFDSGRQFLPSSPYISPEAFKLGIEFYPEEHLWGPRDYYKSDYYKYSKAYFVSETGYHGCPARKSIEKIVDDDYVWPYKDNEQWNLHSSDQRNRPARTMLMHNQVLQLFGEVPDNLDDYTLASQISQAEAKKYFIERVRCKMSTMGGIIWWNLIDGWPEMSDAVVDYFYEKKLAYDFIKRSSRPFIITLDEMGAWGHDVICANGTLRAISGTVTIRDIDNDSVLFEREFTAGPNSNTNLGQLGRFYSQKGMLLISWKTDFEDGFNTYLYGTPAFSFSKYKEWLKLIEDFSK